MSDSISQLHHLCLCLGTTCGCSALTGDTTMQKVAELQNIVGQPHFLVFNLYSLFILKLRVISSLSAEMGALLLTTASPAQSWNITGAQ